MFLCVGGVCAHQNYPMNARESTESSSSTMASSNIVPVVIEGPLVGDSGDLPKVSGDLKKCFPKLPTTRTLGLPCWHT
jgi:hypothetical protein